MKKLLLVLLTLFMLNPIFAKTVQCVKKYQVFIDNSSYGETEPIDVTPQIQYMLNAGWKVVSITPITKKLSYSNPTSYIIVIFEKEEEDKK